MQIVSAVGVRAGYAPQRPTSQGSNSQCLPLKAYSAV